MEDMARLALVEQSVKHQDEFIKILYELLRLISYILENPHDYEIRTIKSNILKEMLKHDAFSDYLKYVGFESINSDYMYPKELTLSNLRMAQAAIERKINFCCGTMNNNRTLIGSKQPQIKRNILTPIHVVKTNNPLMVRIQEMFNNMLAYEDEDLQAYARDQIPIVTLQLMALDRMREQQKKLKTGEIKGHDMPFDIALLAELMEWFKYKFFSWVDKPDCDICGGPTEFYKSENMKAEKEICRVEVYKCRVCGGAGGARFPRYNNPRTLLRSRRGRCGEWANCFALMCRALGYDTRYVLDMSDHVWCEVFDYDSNKWLHVDPCECKLDAPLIYEHGWKKQLSYVIAMSRDDLQDVTWRYTLDHKQVLKRRNLCSETELIMSIMTLREHRQRQVSDARRRYLAKRTLQELVQLMVEKKPGDYESQGRVSGSWKWRAERGETGGHTFTLPSPGHYHLQYYPGQDKYITTCGGTKLEELKGWSAGAYRIEKVFRKVEQDWRQVYLAREEGEPSGSILWKLSVADEGLKFKSLRIKLSSALYENGVIKWTLKFDNEQPITADLGEVVQQFEREFISVEVGAKLEGGSGDVAWQHAQLFRQPLDSKSSAFHIEAIVVKCHK